MKLNTRTALLVLIAFALTCLVLFDVSASTLLIAPAVAAVPLDDIAAAIADNAKAFKEYQDEDREKRSMILSRLQDIEQRVSADQHKGIHYGSDVPVINLSPVFEDARFAHVRNGTKGAAVSAVLEETSIKALVNDSSDVSSGDNTFATRPDRLGLRLGQALRPLRLLDVLPSRPVSSNAIEYVQLDWAGDPDYQLAEGDEKAEMDFEGTLKTANIATIAVHTTASAQVLDDTTALSSQIQRVMTHKVSDFVERNLITGSGTGNRIHGLYHQASTITTGQDGVAERIGQAIVTMENEGYTVNVILMNPNDWFELSITKDADGNYIYGNPASPASPSLWNRPVITSPSIPEGTAMVGNTAELNVLDRQQPTVFISRDHKDYRTRNLVLILVEVRVGMELYDTKAFRKIDLGASG